MICRWYRSFGTEKQEGRRTRAFSVGHICTLYSVCSVYFQSVQDLFLPVFCPLKCQEVHSRIRFFAITSLLHSSHCFPQIIECLFFLFKPRQKAQGSVYTHCTCMHPRGLGRSYHIILFAKIQAFSPRTVFKFFPRCNKLSLRAEEFYYNLKGSMNKKNIKHVASL